MPAAAPLAGVLLLGWVPVGWVDVGVVFVWGLQKARRGHKAPTGVFTLGLKNTTLSSNAAFCCWWINCCTRVWGGGGSEKFLTFFSEKCSTRNLGG